MDYRDFFDLSGFKFGTGGIALVVLLAVWELVWKGFGLWKAAKNGQTGWFIAILVLNTLGVLPILYLYAFSPKPANTK